MSAEYVPIKQQKLNVLNYNHETRALAFGLYI